MVQKFADVIGTTLVAAAIFIGTCEIGFFAIERVAEMIDGKHQTVFDKFGKKYAEVQRKEEEG